MAVTSEDSICLVNASAVAVDRDRNSLHAGRWAVDHLAVNGPPLVLIHVRHVNHQYQAVAGGNGGENEMNLLFAPFRAYAARKDIQLKEVVLDDVDVSRAILEYVTKSSIVNIAVGASSRNAFARKFKNDIPNNLMKSAPDFCAVYVISKGKVQSVRKTLRTAATPPRNPPPQALPIQMLHDSSVSEDGAIREQPGKGSSRSAVLVGTSVGKGNGVMRGTKGERGRNSSSNLSMDSMDISFIRPRIPTGPMCDDSEFSETFNTIEYLDLAPHYVDLSSSSGSSKESNSHDLEAEMRRLKLELKQTMDMYSSACKEALSAKQRAEELNQWKMEEARKFEEARIAEETALAIAEIEKAKCKAAVEAAEKAQKLAELEAQKRKYAEMKAKQEAEEKNRALSALAHNDVRYRKYTIEEIERATENFSLSNKIGEGGYGPVYKGKLDHTAVAIKVLRPDAAQGQKQFQQEIEVLSCIRHPNMVILLGACPEYGCLVYEYMDNGSLEDRLLQRGNTPPISWKKRFQIAAEIATALLFLHQSKPEPLVHRDLKPANILLDRNYVSKISDVGLARLVPPSVADNVTQYHMTSAAGTFCYIDPEYQQTGKLTTRSDTYSLGIMLLQIIAAKPPMGLAHLIIKAIERGRFAEVLDPKVPDWPIEETLQFAKLALKCAELRKKDRPSLANVVVPELNRLRDLERNSEPPRHGRSHDSNSPRHRSRSRSPLPRPPVFNSHGIKSNSNANKEMRMTADKGSASGFVSKEVESESS